MSRDLPDPDQLMNREVAETTKIYDRSGKILLYQVHGEQQRTLMSLEEIPDHVKQAAIAIEDKNFYEHEGFSLWAIFRTAITNLVRHQKAGASTLTQQLVKNTVLSPEKTYTRKIKELILAYRLENTYSKDEILQMYLNEIPYGGMAYGVEAASQHYFGKSVTEVNTAEAAVLAALPQAPSYYSPYGPNKERLLSRQRYIINLMKEQGYLTEEEAEKASNTKISFKEPGENIKAPHFVMYVQELLAEKYGQRVLEQGGLKIRTTLDWFKQKRAEDIIEKKVEHNLQNYNAENAALVSIDPKTGQILSMVGSKDFSSEDINGQFNVAIANRQPGSSLKPMAYAEAFEKGYKPETVLYDTETDFNAGEDEYKPQNFDDQTRGPISMRKSLAGSLNIPSVKTLYLAEKDTVIERLRDLGYTTFADNDKYGLSLVLGGGEVKLLEHTNAYGAFAREGDLHPHAAILEVKDNEGETVEEFKEKTRTTWNEDAARMINDILSDNNAREFVLGRNRDLNLGDREVAVKTGTTNDFKDGWTIGYTPSLVTGVWVGNNDNTPMADGAYGGTVAAPIWNEYMNTILGDTPKEDFKDPKIENTGKAVIDGDIEASSTEKVKIDKASGLLATEHTPENYIKEVTFENHHSILHYVDKEDPLGEKPDDPEEEEQYELWEEGVRQWAEEEFKDEDEIKPMQEKPQKEDNLHKPDNQPTFDLEGIKNKQILTEPMLNINISNASAPRGVSKVEYYIDGTPMLVATSYPFSFSRNIDFLDNGYHDLTVTACDDIDNCRSKDITFNLELEEDNSSLEDEVADISWIYPQDRELELTSSDFPMDLGFKVNKPKTINQLEVILFPIDATSSDPIALHSEGDVDSSLAVGQWDDPPAPGTYYLYGRVFSGQGVTESNKKTVVVTK